MNTGFIAERKGKKLNCDIRKIDIRDNCFLFDRWLVYWSMVGSLGKYHLVFM